MYNLERSSEAGWYVKATCGKQVLVSQVRFLSLKQLNFLRKIALLLCVARWKIRPLFSRLVTKSLILNCAPNKRAFLQVAFSRVSVRRDGTKKHAGLEKREEQDVWGLEATPVFGIFQARVAISLPPKHGVRKRLARRPLKTAPSFRTNLANLYKHIMHSSYDRHLVIPPPPNLIDKSQKGYVALWDSMRYFKANKN